MQFDWREPGSLAGMIGKDQVTRDQALCKGTGTGHYNPRAHATGCILPDSTELQTFTTEDTEHAEIVPDYFFSRYFPTNAAQATINSCSSAVNMFAK